MSAFDLIDSFSVPVTVRRFGPSTYENGKVIPGASEDFPSRMSVQPLVGKDLLNLTEAQRSKRTMKVYSPIELRTVSEITKAKADHIFYDGVWFEVQTVMLWKDGIESLDHWECVIAEFNQ